MSVASQFCVICRHLMARLSGVLSCCRCRSRSIHTVVTTPQDNSSRVVVVVVVVVVVFTL